MPDYDKAFLTIAIPTYNRPEAIQKQVRNLLPQLIPGTVNLIVCDNASPTPVETLFSTDEKEKFTIVRNKVNIGADANIARCLEACCDSEWGYAPGDDDDLFPDAIARILQQIENNQNALFINFGCEKDEILNTKEEILCSLGRNLGGFGNAIWISKGVYHTRMMQEYYCDLNIYSYTFAGQLFLLLSYLKKHDNAVVIRLSEPLFTDSGKSSWKYFDLVQRLFPFYDYWSSENKKQKGVRCFLDNITSIQIVFLADHFRKEKDLRDIKKAVFVLKRIFLTHNRVWCFAKRFRYMVIIYLSIYFPVGLTLLNYCYQHFRKVSSQTK